MSSVKSLKRWISTIRELQVLEIAKYAPEYSRALISHKLDKFDLLNGTDTSQIVPACDLKPLEIHGAHKHANLYWPTNPHDFHKILSSLSLDWKDYTFIDIGCGKGRTLLMAARHPFKRIVGIDFSPALCDIAQKNIHQFFSTLADSKNITVQCQDAASFNFPPDKLVVYMFDPFKAEVMQHVVNNLNESLLLHPRECYIIYYLPMHARMFEEKGFRTIASQPRNWRLRYPWRVYYKES